MRGAFVLLGTALAYTAPDAASLDAARLDAASVDASRAATPFDENPSDGLDRAFDGYETAVRAVTLQNSRASLAFDAPAHDTGLGHQFTSDSKIVWLFWSQGETDLLQQTTHPRYKHAHQCLWAWRILNPTWRVVLLDDAGARKIAPVYAANAELGGVRGVQLLSDLLRLELLARYGGVWADMTVCPVQPLDRWLPQQVSHTGFFTFWYGGEGDCWKHNDTRDAGCENNYDTMAHDSRITPTWFLASTGPHHALLEPWFQKLRAKMDTFTPVGKVWKYVYFLAHCMLAQLNQQNETVHRELFAMPHHRVGGAFGYMGSCGDAEVDTSKWMYKICDAFQVSDRSFQRYVANHSTTDWSTVLKSMRRTAPALRSSPERH